MNENSDTTHTADGFSAEWLQLREPADHRARSTLLTQLLLDWRRDKERMNIIELGAGTGSNLRYLCPLLGHQQHWTLFDHDQSLLEQLPHLLTPWAQQQGIHILATRETIRLESDTFSAQIHWQQKDLANELNAIAQDKVHLITASALLDLTSAAWLEQLARLCIDKHCASLFVLNYDGTLQWHEKLPDDELLNQLLNEHQLTDKGFGNALGPQAHHYIAEQLRRAQHVTTQSGNWVLDQQQSALQNELLTGWVKAAMEQDTTRKPVIQAWAESRRLAIKQGHSYLSVGHTDVLSLPMQWYKA